MSIADFIRENVLRPRLKQAGALVVYDADKRYREQCFDLAGDKVRVIATSAPLRTMTPPPMDAATLPVIDAFLTFTTDRGPDA